MDNNDDRLFLHAENVEQRRERLRAIAQPFPNVGIRDSEVLAELEKAQESGQWMIAIYVVDRAGRIRLFRKTHEYPYGMDDPDQHMPTVFRESLKLLHDDLVKEADNRTQLSE